jgi:hypothetical protein
VHGTHQLYSVRVNGHLEAAELSAFPAMVAHVDGKETVLIGLLRDRSAVFGVLAQVEALDLELVEIRPVRPRPRSPGTGDADSPPRRRP